MRKSLFITIAVFFTQTGYSQKTFKAGYIIKSNGDTIQGFIDYRKWNKNPDKINFKDSAEGAISTFTPLEIKEFGVEGDIYTSAIVDSEYSSKKIDQLEDTPGLNIRKDTVFLQTLISGDKSLYYYKNSVSNDNFYIKWDDGYELLKYKVFARTHNDQLVKQENRTFAAQLVNYLDGCPALSPKTRDLRYDKKSLTKLFNFYYSCSNADLFFKKKKEKLSLDFGLLAGVSMSTLNFSSSSFYYLINAGYDMSTNFSGGIFLDFVMPGNQGKWSLNTELLYTSYDFTGQYKEITNDEVYTITNTEIGYSYLKLNILLRFKYPAGKAFIYINGGLANGFALSETNYKERITHVYGQISITEGKALEDARNYEQGFILGLGTKFNRFSIEARYEGSNGMSEYPGLKSAIKRYYFLFGFKF